MITRARREHRPPPRVSDPPLSYGVTFIKFLDPNPDMDPSLNFNPNPKSSINLPKTYSVFDKNVPRKIVHNFLSNPASKQTDISNQSLNLIGGCIIVRTAKTNKKINTKKESCKWKLFFY